MELRPIRNKREHAAALREAEVLWHARKGSPGEDRLLVLTLLIETYEREHFPIPAPEPHIGSRARVAEVLNRVRPLTIEMIRRLCDGLGLPADVLIQGYKLRKAA